MIILNSSRVVEQSTSARKSRAVLNMTYNITFQLSTHGKWARITEDSGPQRILDRCGAGPIWVQIEHSKDPFEYDIFIQIRQRMPAHHTAMPVTKIQLQLVDVSHPTGRVQVSSQRYAGNFNS